MGKQNNFRVVIGGGGVTGLALANMLQLYGIDFVLLEAKQVITLENDTSATLLPHANRILDQLGFYDKLLTLSRPIDSLHYRDSSGEVIRKVQGLDHAMRERHGYPILCSDTRSVVQVLYDNIQDRGKIVTKKEVHRLHVSDKGVTVRTSDGSSFDGDIVIAADDSQSTIRTEMWRIGNEVSPDLFSNDQERKACHYGCISGISEPCQGIDPGSRTSVFGKHGSLLVNSGPEDRLHWSYLFKLAERASDSQDSYLSDKGKKEALDAIVNDKITPNVRFQQLIDRTASFVSTPLETYEPSTWFFQRIMIIGDAAQKMLPITGYSESTCIEFGAILANALYEVQGGSQGYKPSLTQMEHSVAAAQAGCLERLRQVNDYAHAQQQSDGFSAPVYHFASLQLLRILDDDTITYNISRSIESAEKLHDSKPTLNSRLIPYKDELLKAPTASGMKKWYWVAAYLLTSGICYYGMWVQPGYYGLWEHLETILTTGEFPYNSGFPLKRVYTGYGTVDNIFVYLAAVFMSGLKDWDPSFRFLNLYFEGSLIQPLAVWTVESYRKRNQLTLLAIVPVWYALSQFTGMGIYMPLYYVAYTFVSAPESYWWPLNREVPVKYAEWMIWAVMVGFGLPTIALFIRWEHPFTLQNVEAFWQLSPLYVPLCCSTLAYLSLSQKAKTVEQPRQGNETTSDVHHLKQLYLITGIIGLIFHIACIGKVLYDPALSLSSVFWPDFTPGQKTLGGGVQFMFLIDVWAMDVATYIWSCQAVWDLKRVGRTEANVLEAAVLIAAANFVLGPGATLCAVWYWREERLARMNFTPASTSK